jgi:histidinol-phosphatase (PHP family)
MLVDYHMHLAADDAPLDEPALALPAIGRYVEAARARGVAEICMTEHVYRFAATRDWFDQPWWRDCARNDVGPYVEALRRARDDEGWPVLVGIELDYLPGRDAELRAWAEGQPWDLILGSVHWLGSLGVDHPDYPVWDAMAVEDVWRLYFDALAEAAATGIYDVMAHPDLVKVFGHRPSEARREQLYEQAAGAFAAAGVTVEVSTAGLRKAARELYPAPAFLAACRRAGVPATLASDAHRPEDVGRDFDLAVAALRDAGYATVARFRGRERQEVPLG